MVAPLPPSGERAAGRSHGWVGVGLAAAALPLLLFPGAAPFINDEPQLILLALKANSAHALATYGLAGNRGLPYGPTAVWIYQSLLTVTRDPIALVLVHAAILGIGTATALLLLARSTRLWPPFAVVIALSPALWVQERSLWDNTFNIPICALALASYAWFLARRSPTALAVAIGAITVAPFIHLMALALVVPLGLHILLFQHRELRRHALLVLPFPLLFLALSWPYLRLVLRSLSAAGDVTPGPNASSAAGAFAFPLLGGRYLSALEYYPSWTSGALVGVARAVSAVAYPLVWLGLVLAAARAVTLLRERREATAQDHLTILALAVVLAQSLLDGAMKVAPHLHYFNATWIAYALLAWVAVDALARVRSWWGSALAGLALLHGLALGIVDVAIVTATRTSPGMQYGATISNQVEVAREVARYPPETPVVSDVYPYREFPHALEAMKLLIGTPAPPSASARRLIIRTPPTAPGSGRAEVVAE